MRYFDLFCGIGGFSLGLKPYGHKCVGACEIDRYARAVYTGHFPKTPVWQDATKIRPEELPDFDILCAGFPCQAFSIAGKRLGFEESRGTLFFEIVRIARQKRPRLLLLENVKGLLSHDGGRTFATVLAALDEIGYDAQWQVLNSKYFVPQNRERVFIVGYLRGTNRPQIFPVRESNEGDNKTQQKTRIKGQRIQNKISGAIDANYHKGCGSRTMIVINSGASQHYRIYEDSGLSSTLNSSCEDRNGKNTLVCISQKNSNMKQRIQERGTPWTLTDNGGDFGIKQGNRIRRLTPKECERLQGFPDDWTAGLSDTQRYRCLGNAVTVPVIEFIAKKLEDANNG